MSEKKEQTGKILGLGNTLLDITAYLSNEDILNKYQVSTNNAILAGKEHLPMFDDIVNTFELSYQAGGACQNSIRVAQWLLPPQSTTFLGCVGNDAYAEKIQSCISKDGVNGIYMTEPSHPTGRCAVLVYDQERALIAHLAASEHFNHKHLLKDSVLSSIQQSNIFYVEGFFFTVSVPSIKFLSDYCHINSKTFVLNISAPFIVSGFFEPFMEVMPYVDILIGNESEALALGKKCGFETDDIEKIACKLSTYNKINLKKSRIVIVTQGSKSTILAQNSYAKVFPVPPVPKTEIIDTNGAGDSFVGGFLSQLVKNKPLEQCVECGHYAAGQIIRVSGVDLSGLSPPLSKFL